MSALPRSRRTISIITLIFIGIVGLVMLVFAIVEVASEQQFISKAVKVTGIVVQLAGDTTSRPVVQYTTTDGQQHTYTSNIKSNPPTHQVGDKVDVYYDPANPDSVVIAGETSSLYSLLGGVGVLLFVLGSITAAIRLLTGR